jgi:hypothetical protein
MAAMKSLLLLGLSLLLFACGGGSGGGGVAPLVGQFIDDPVSGLAFVCTGAPGTSALTGITDVQGQFNYLPGQSCVFKVGKVTLGGAITIPSDGKVTPQDVAGVTRSATTAPSAVAIAQFLQSLDEKTTSGKIVLSSTSRDAFNTHAVTELSLTSSSGAVSQEELQYLVSVVGKTLVSPTVATDALNRQIALNHVNPSVGLVSTYSPPTLNSIRVTSANASQAAGLPVQMSAMGYYSNGAIADISSTVTWTSMDESALTISASGLATGLKKGRVAVIASLQAAGSLVAVKGSLVHTTLDPVLSAITISNSNALPVGLTDQLIASGTFSDGTKADLTHLVTWTSSDPRILSINAQGLATGLMQGTVKVTADYLPAGASSALTASFTETVIAPTVLNLVISYVQSALTAIQNKATALLQAVIVFSDKTTQTVSSLVTWTVSTVSGGAGATISTGRFASDDATLVATNPGVISIAASYLGFQSQALDLTITAQQPTVQNAAITLNVMGVYASSATGSITATDPQGYPLRFSIQSDGAVGRATVDSSSGTYTYTVSGHTSASSDAFKVLVSNGKTSSLATVTVTLNTDPLLQNQWHIQNQGFTAFASVLPAHANDMNVAGAWSMGYSGKGIKVAVIDTGLEVAHEDLAANVDVANSRNFLTGTSNPTPTVTGYDHGTQVAGIIGAVGFNGKGGRGVAYGATLRGYNYLTAQSTVNLANSLGLASYSADNDIFNESFRASPTNLDPANESTYQAINDHLLSMRGGKGAILIQSAGNEFLSFNDGTAACSTANKYGVSCATPRQMPAEPAVFQSLWAH